MWSCASIRRHRSVARLQRTRQLFAIDPTAVAPSAVIGPWPQIQDKHYPATAARVVRAVGRAVAFVCNHCGRGASQFAAVSPDSATEFVCLNCARPGWHLIGIPKVPPRRIEILVDPTNQPAAALRGLISAGSTPHLNMLPVVARAPRLQERAERHGMSPDRYAALLATAEVPDARDYLALLHVGASPHPVEVTVSGDDRRAAAVFAYVSSMGTVTVPRAETMGMSLMDAETGAVGITVVKVANGSSAAAAGIVPGTVLMAVNGTSLIGKRSLEGSAALFAAAAAVDSVITLQVHPCTQHHRAGRIEPRVPSSAATLVEASALSLLTRGREVAGAGLCVVLVARPALIAPIRRALRSDSSLAQFEMFGCADITVTQYGGSSANSGEQVRLIELRPGLGVEPIALSLTGADSIVVTALPPTMASTVRRAIDCFVHTE